MSQENVEIFQLAVDAWNRQDIEGILAFADPEIEYVNAPGAVEPGTKRGRDEYAAVVRAQWDAFPDGCWEIDRIHDRGDEMIVEGRVSRSMPGSDARVGNPLLVSVRFRHGKATRIEVLGAGSEVPDALRAVGLSEQDAHADS
jgi:ketosteroid isomerase-like protein